MSGLRVVVVSISYLTLFFPAECFNFPGGGDCGLSGLSFGGRLLLPNQVGVTHPWDGRRAIIFQTTRQGRAMFGGHGGRGRILVTPGQACHGPTSQQQSCPMRESIPCMDSSMPCSIDLGPPPAPPGPSYTDHSPLVMTGAAPGEVTVTRPEWDQTVGVGIGPVVGWKIMVRQDGAVQNITRSGDEHSYSSNHRPGTSLDIRIALVNRAGNIGPLSDWQTFTTPCGDLEGANISLTSTTRTKGNTKLIVNWVYQTRSAACAVKNQTIRFEQLDRDNCSPEESGGLDDVQRVLDTPGPGDRPFPLRRLNANSLFRVTVTVITMTDQAFSISGLKRTIATAPSGRPIVGEPTGGRRRSIIFTWSALPCGERNSADTIDYEYLLTSSDGQQWTNTVQLAKVRIAPVPSGETYTFRVRAHSEHGYGDYSAQKTGTF